MYEKCNMSHPDKIADRIAGAIVDLAYSKCENPKVAVEVLLGHKKCLIINETNTHIDNDEINAILCRLAPDITKYDYYEVAQDTHLAKNQEKRIKCGDNGIFKGVPVSQEQQTLTNIVSKLYDKYNSDGKYIINDERELIIACQSKCKEKLNDLYYDVITNPLGYWEGGLNVDSGATNRKLGSDMGDSVTGGGLHGKDLSKADVSVNIYAFLKAQATGEVVELYCAIGDEFIDGIPYANIVDIARRYIKSIGGFEKFAEWGLIRPRK